MKIALADIQNLEFNRAGKCISAKYIYNVSQLSPTDTLFTAAEAVRKFAPATLADGAVKRDSVAVDSFDRAKNPAQVKISVTYIPIGGVYLSRAAGSRGENKSNDRKWTFDGNAQTVHITRAISQKKVGGPATAPDAGLLIEWNGRHDESSSINGVDIYVPTLSRVCTATYSASTVTVDFMKRICAATGKVNSTEFEGHAVGEVLFLGAADSEEYENNDGDLLKDVTFRFAIQPNESNVEIGGYTVAGKKGWEYIWAIQHTFGTKVEIGGIYLAEVYKTMDFGGLI